MPQCGTTWKEIPRSFGDLLKYMPMSDLPRTRQPSKTRLTLPSTQLSGDLDDLDMAPCHLTILARCMMRLLFDWPFIRVSQLQMMLGVSEGHMKRAKALLARLGLVYHLRIGRNLKQQYDNETRLCLSKSALRYLSLVDRSLYEPRREKRKKVVGLVGHWLVEPNEAGDEAFRIPDYLIMGTKAATLLKERLHTDGIYTFVSILTGECRNSSEWGLQQALPAHRWERRFKYGTRNNAKFKDVERVIKPDATLVLERAGRNAPSRSFFLEMERRATSPSKIAPKLAPYRAYYDSSDTEYDFDDGRPGVLFVFDKSEHAAHFTKYASRDGGSAIPMLVSSLDRIKSNGVFGPVWLMPWHLNAGFQRLDAGLRTLDALR